MKMKTMKKVKYAWDVWLTCLIILLFPYDLGFLFQGVEKNELVIENQACACPCPDAKIISGKLIILDSQRAKLNDSMLETYLTGVNPFNDTNNWGLKMKVKGIVLGTKPDYCFKNSCHYIPVF